MKCTFNKYGKNIFDSSIFIPWIDLLVNQLVNRFEKHENVLTKFQYLAYSTKSQENQVVELCAFYRDDIAARTRVCSESGISNLMRKIRLSK